MNAKVVRTLELDNEHIEYKEHKRAQSRLESERIGEDPEDTRWLGNLATESGRAAPPGNVDEDLRVPRGLFSSPAQLSYLLDLNDQKPLDVDVNVDWRAAFKNKDKGVGGWMGETA